MGGLARLGRRVYWREPAELPRGRIFWPRPDIPDTSDLQRAWAKHEPASALLSGTRPEGADTGLGAGGRARCDNFEGGKCAMSIRQDLADR